MTAITLVAPDRQLDALARMSWRLPEQERHEVESMATTRRQAGHLRWISPVQEGRLSDLYRKHVLRERAT